MRLKNHISDYYNFFAAYVKCKKNYSFSRVVFLFFQSKIANSFYSKKMTAMGLGQQCSQAVGPGSSLCRAKYFNDFTWHWSEISMVPMAQWVGQQGFEAVGTGSEPSLYLRFLNTAFTYDGTSWHCPPSYAWKVSIPQFFWNQEVSLIRTVQ